MNLVLQSTSWWPLTYKDSKYCSEKTVPSYVCVYQGACSLWGLGPCVDIWNNFQLKIGHNYKGNIFQKSNQLFMLVFNLKRFKAKIHNLSLFHFNKCIWNMCTDCKMFQLPKLFQQLTHFQKHNHKQTCTYLSCTFW